jgi:hypothetical protein
VIFNRLILTLLINIININEHRSLMKHYTERDGQEVYPDVVSLNFCKLMVG